uniref:BTB domain-containing protein n=1 Tax=Meloidogyne hapla TaxID=6305 RepID=A0A1I8BQW8_MELHA
MAIEEEQHKTFVSLNQVGLKDFNDTLKTIISIYALDGYGGRVNICSSELVNFSKNTESPLYGIPLNRASHPDGSVLLYCEIEFIPENLKCGTYETDDYSDESGAKKLLLEMLEQGTFSDFYGDQRINVHKCILAHNSEIFRVMFEQKGMIEAQLNELNLPDLSLDCILAMIDYFYRGSISKGVLERLDQNLFEIAHKYQVFNLIEILERFMSSNIDKFNFGKRCLCFTVYGLSMLQEACIRFIKNNRSWFVGSEEWIQFEIENQGLASILMAAVLNG